MPSWEDERLRRMYVGGKGNATARRYVKVWNVMLRTGLLPRRWVVLEVPGRTTGKRTRLPLGMARLDGRWHLVSMLGECNWTKNVRAAGGRARLLRVRGRDVALTEVPVAQRPPILKEYLLHVPGGRPHISVDKDAPVSAFEAIAADYPVFTVSYV